MSTTASSVSNKIALVVEDVVELKEAVRDFDDRILKIEVRLHEVQDELRFLVQQSSRTGRSAGIGRRTARPTLSTATR